MECVGRLQDHADVLDDVRNDLLVQVPRGSNMEELQIQIEECQVSKLVALVLCGVYCMCAHHVLIQCALVSSHWSLRSIS